MTVKGGQLIWNASPKEEAAKSTFCKQELLQFNFAEISFKVNGSLSCSQNTEEVGAYWFSLYLNSS